MSSLVRQFSFALTVVATLASGAWAQPTSLEPQQGVLTLRSGGVIAGRYSKLGDQYVVVVNGGEIRIDASKVEVACQSLSQAYDLKRAAMSQHSVSAHLRLAQWCIRHKLFDQAGAEILTARNIDDADRRIATIQRRLQAVIHQQATARKVASQPVHVPDQGELERWLGSLPNRSVEQFAKTIQPLLSNRCATGACHGSTSDRVDVHVLRVPRGRRVSRRATARNLREVIKWVDRAQPGQSPLLAVPTHPHANAEAAIFSAGDNEQYRQLVSWVYGLSQQPAGVLPGRGGSDMSHPFAGTPVLRSPWGNASPLLQPTPVPWQKTSRLGPGRTPVHHALAQQRQAIEEAAAALAEQDSSGTIGDANKDGPTPGAPIKGAVVPAGRYIPVDEFDPEIFNRRRPVPATDEP